MVFMRPNVAVTGLPDNARPMKGSGLRFIPFGSSPQY
jgi:hypothetical protein